VRPLEGGLDAWLAAGKQYDQFEEVDDQTRGERHGKSL